MFERPSYQSYYLDVERMVQAALAKEHVSYLLSVNYQDYLQHLVDHIRWDTLEWDETSMTIEPFIGKRRISDYGREVEVEQPRLRLRIPVSHHPQLSDYLRYQPSSQHSMGEPEWNFRDDTLLIEIPASDEAVRDILKEVRFWLGGRNRDILEGNATLQKRIDAVWKRKREELESHMGDLDKVVEKLKIPLHQDPSAPKPVSLQPRSSRRPRPPAGSAKKNVEPELVREDVIEVVTFVESYSRQLEVTPGVYNKLSEEELRDLVLGMLNVNYPGSTGESFCKLGKTDMLLRIGGEGSLIVECKKWKGQKHYGNSLAQLFGYLTWRHSYGILLTFCVSKDMTAAVDAARSSISSQESLISGAITVDSATRFSWRHIHPQDRERTVEVFHLFVDLSM